MGLTHNSMGRGAIDSTTVLHKNEVAVVLAGNPNVGKSTVFNALTGMNQHTGNWAGKTVSVAQGTFQSLRHRYTLVDVPGTYSLLTHSKEEEVARDFIVFGGCDMAVVVCDATCLERSLALALQVAEAVPRTIVCVNLLDEAKSRGISVDTKVLSEMLRLPIVGVSARKKKTLTVLTSEMDREIEKMSEPAVINYPEAIEREIDVVSTALSENNSHLTVPKRWAALRLLEEGEAFAKKADIHLPKEILDSAKERLFREGFTQDILGDTIAKAIAMRCSASCRLAVKGKNSDKRDRCLDRLFTGKYTAYPIMLLFLAFIFWVTIVGANYPSQALSSLLMRLQTPLYSFFDLIGLPSVVCEALVYGAYKVLAWVVSVMLPPMAMFFPLFTLLEDFGYLPRIAYNLDKPFHRCNACGKQALTICMGFGCNAAGVVGCRIIDSPRERLLATITNSFVPCNGRFPMMIAIICVFFAPSSDFTAVVTLCAMVLLGIGATLIVTYLLSITVLRGNPSSFTLELPPYRVPQVGKVIVRSIFDRTLFVLGRACAVAAPCGLLIWILANITVGDASILSHISQFLDPLGKIMGLDGTILTAFIIGLPANEIVVPIILMMYLSSGTLSEMGSTAALGEILSNSGWTAVTALCFLIFALMHWPCSTTILTIYKETKSIKWTLYSVLVPTLCGFILCTLVNAVATLIR